MGGRQQNGPSHVAASGEDMEPRGRQPGETWGVSREQVAARGVWTTNPRVDGIWGVSADAGTER